MFAQTAQLILRLLGLGTSFGAVFILARYLGPEAYGTLALGLTVSSIVLALSDSGIYPIGVAQMASTGPTIAQVYQMMWARLTLSLAAILLIAAGGFLFLGFTPYVVVVICACGAVPYSVVAFRALPESLVRPVLVGLIIASQNVAWLILVALGSVLSWPLEGFALLNVASITVQATAAYLVARSIKTIPADSAVEPWTVLLRKSTPVIVSSIWVTAYYRGHQIYIYDVVGAAQSGNYAAAMRLLDAAQVLPATASSVLLPRVAKALGQGRSTPSRTVRAIISRSSLAVFGVTAAVAAGVWVAAPLLANFLLGPQFTDAADYMRLVFLAFPFISIAYLLSACLVALRRRVALAVTTSATAISAGVAMIFVVPVAGAYGAAVTLAISEVVTSSCLAIVVYRATKAGTRG